MKEDTSLNNTNLELPEVNFSLYVQLKEKILMLWLGGAYITSY